ncbi:MAG TPA: pilus assembly PilX N-terminal domain-containing protein [Gemmatimonadaceae bacterium]|nr:pilus assembly PilX N-terminal domain-containing protein [Gemmatimonadaceae bacterium]
MLNNTARRGFAIPVALLIIAALTIMVAGGFSLVSAERRSVADQKAQISAFRIAEQGLELFLIRRDSLMAGHPGYSHVPGLTPDTAIIPMTGGTATVTLTRLRPVRGSQSGLYVARSRGVETTGAYAGTPQGVRTVAQYVLWEPAPMQVLAGWTALSGLQKNGGAGTLGGIDLCGDSAAVAGVVVPVNPGYTGKVVAVGNPPVDSVAPDSVAIDWNNILNNNAIQPSIIMPGMVWPTGLMEAAYANDNSTYYPIVRFNGDMVLPSSGRGMLIITGSLTINGNTGWKGVIMVGDDIVSNGNNGIEGATVSGLNTKIGTYHPGDIDPSTANGTKQYNYNSCEVAKATTTMGALVTLRNTWVDNWVEY